jgi:hypothetical protein
MTSIRLRRSVRAAVAALALAMLAALLPGSVALAAGVHLSFTTSAPNPAHAGVNFPVTVHVQDNAAAPLTGVSVTLDIAPNHNPGNATLVCGSGTVIVSNNNGNANFTSCHIDKPGSGYELRARASGAATVTSVAFDVEVGPAAALRFAGYPANPTPPTLTPQPVVEIVDAGGNVVTTNGQTVTLSIDSHAGTFSCSGGLSKAAVHGVATFTGCSQTTLASGYHLTAKANNLTSVTGAAFQVAAGGASQLLFCWGAALPCSTTPPTTITGGLAFPVQPVIRVTDAAGNTITTDSSSQVTLSILLGTPTSGGPGTLSCNGGLTKKVTAGVAKFAGCAINRAGTGYRLHVASTPALIAADSTAFNVAVGPGAKLGFVAGPAASVTVGMPFGPISVAVEDAGGNVATAGVQGTIRLSIGNNPGGGALTCAGGLDAAIVGNVATFNGCTISGAGQGYRLSARMIAPPNVVGTATSAAFNVVPNGVALSLSTTPSDGVIFWGQTAVLTVHLATNGIARQVTLEVSRDKVTWSSIAAIATDTAGNASFDYRPSDNRYYRATFAGAPDLPATTSAIARIVVRQINLLRPTNDGAVRHVAVGTTVHFTSTVRPDRPDLPTAHVNFVVYRLSGGVWQQVFTTTEAVDSSGIARLDVTFGSHASYYVRSQAVPTTLNANSGWSPVERYDAG